MKKLFVLFVLMFALAPVAFAHEGHAHASTMVSGDTATVTDPVQDDVFVSGTNVNVNAPVSGEVFSAGNNVSITKRSNRSIFAAGNTVAIDEGAGYNVFAAGSAVTLKGTIEKDVYVFGQTITIDSSTHIKGTLRAFGQNLTLAGKVDGDVFTTAETVTSSATVGGSFIADVKTLSFTSGSIAKDLTYTASSEAQGLDKVAVAGKTQFTTVSSTSNRAVNQWFYGLLATLVTGAALLLLVPKKLADIQRTAHANWQPFLSGLVGLVGLPIAAGVLMATRVGFPLGLVVLVLYIIMLFLAVVMAQIVFGHRLLALAKVKNINSWLALLVGATVLALLNLIPGATQIVQPLFFLVLVLPVLGATFLWWKKQLEAARS